MSKKSQCRYVYVNGLRLPADSVFVEYTENGKTVQKRLVQFPDGHDSITAAAYKKYIAATDTYADGRVPVTVKTPRGDVTSMILDLDFAFASKGRRLSPPKVGETYYSNLREEPLSADDAAKLAELSLRGLSYGRNHSTKHAERVRWALDHASPGTIRDWLNNAKQSTLQEDNYHSFVINLLYLRRRDPGYVEAFFRGDPVARSRMLAMVPLLTAETDIGESVSPLELASFVKMLESGGAISSQNEHQVETVVQDGMRQAMNLAGASGAGLPILRQHAEDMVRYCFDLVELHKRGGMELILTEGRQRMLSVVQNLSVLLSHPRAGGYPLGGAPGEQVQPIMGSSRRLPTIDAFRNRDRFATGFSEQLTHRLPAYLAEVKHYDPVRLVEANFGPRREGDNSAYDAEYATSSPLTLVTLFEMLSTVAAVSDPGPLIGVLRDAPNEAARDAELAQEQDSYRIEADLEKARAEYDVWRVEAARHKKEYEAFRASSTETFSALAGLRDVLAGRNSALVSAEQNDGHHRLTSTGEFAAMSSSYGNHTVKGTFIAHTGSEVWVRLAGHGETDSVQFQHSVDVGSFNAIGSQWNRERKGHVIEVSFAANRSTAPLNALIHFPPVYQSTDQSQERLQAAQAAYNAAKRSHDETAERLERDYQARDAANDALQKAESALFAAATKVQKLEQELREIRTLLESA